MPALYRFCAVFPLFLLILALGGCAGPGQNPWKQSQTGAQNTSQNQSAASSPYGSSAAFPTTAATTGTSVKVAILLPLSGSNAGVGQSMLQAAQLALFDLGYDNFELMPRDTGGTASGASAAAGAAMADGAQLILGPLFAEEVRAVKSATSGRGINVIAFSTDWTLAGGNTFLMGFMPFGQVERIADYAVAKGLKRTAVVSNADTYGTTVSSAFESKAGDRGLTVVRSVSDPSSYDSVFIPAGGSDLTAILARIPAGAAQKLGTGLWDDSRIASMPQMKGAWFAAPSPNARAGFESRYQSTYGAKPVRIATLAYDATALAAALSKSGGFDAASLTNSNGFAGVDGIVRFNKNGMAERGLAVLGIQGGRIVELDAAPTVFKQ